MALVLADRVRESTLTTGTGTVTLVGPVTGYQTFAAIGDGNTTYYTISNPNGTEWEVGIGTYTAASKTLSRDTVLSSSNGGAKTSFSVGSKDVFVSYPAEKSINQDEVGNTFVPNLGATTPSSGVFTTLTGNSTSQFGRSSANYFQAVGAAANLSPEMSVLGSDTNIPFTIESKGTGAVNVAAGSRGVNVSNGGTVTAITASASGASYTSIPTLTIAAPTTAGGVQATANALMFTSAATVAGGGTGYTLNDVLTIVGGTTSGAVGTYTVTGVTGGVITSVSRTAGSGYSVLPSNPVSVTGGTGSGATLNLLWVVSGATITNAGSGYVEQPTVTFSGGGGSGAAAYATVGSGTTVRTLGSTMSFSTPQGEVVRLVEAGTQPVVNYATITPRATGNGPIIGVGGTDTNAPIVLSSKGTSQLSFFTNNTAQEQFRVAHTASAVNYVQVTGSVTGAGAGALGGISFTGSDTNVNGAITTKGTGYIAFAGSAGTNNQAFRVITANAANTGNLIAVQGAAAGSSPSIQAISGTSGTDTNVALSVRSQGTGAINLAPGSSGVNVSNGNTVTAITRTAAGSGYTSFPTITISAPTTAGGVQATASPTTMIANVATVQAGGTGYTLNDVVTLSGGTPSVAATYTVTGVSGGVVTAVTPLNFGTYTVLPANPVSTTGGTGTGLTLNVTYAVPNSFTITNAGSGYVEQPTVTFSGGGGSGAAAIAVVGSIPVIRSVNSGLFLSAAASSSQPVLRLESVGNPANSLFIYNNATGNDPVLRAIGTDTNVSTIISSQGTGSVRFFTNAVNQEQLRVTHTASAVNYVQVTGAATTGTPVVQAQGSDTNVSLAIRAKGGGGLFFQPNSLNQFAVVSTTSAANYLQATGAVASSSPVLSAQGSDTNIDITLTPKGTGLVRFGTYVAGALTATGYINIKAADGTTYKVLVST